jgi:phage terminase large subunit
MTEQEINLPHLWRARDYQRPLWRFLKGGGKRAVAVWHRRSGKDDLALHWTACAAHIRKGTYWHMLPEYGQARKAIWEAVNPHTGMRRIDEAFPEPLREQTLRNEMFIRFGHGSTWQLVGSDNFDSLVGSPPAGVVFSEYALADPRAWAMLRPILLENDGWALFISTPRGRNHYAKLFELAQAEPGWFGQKLGVEETRVFTPVQLATERRELIAEHGEEEGDALFRQEYHCDFSASLLGSYYAREIDRADAEGRVTRVPHDPGKSCVTAWDLGIGDSTVVWIAQQVGYEVRVLDCFSGSGVGLEWYVQQLLSRPYTYSEHILPHDAGARELGSGKTREETLKGLGVGRTRILPQQSVEDGINAVRRVLPSVVFDGEKCSRGLEALRLYRREWDDKHKVFRPRPLHDWTSDYCFEGNTLVLTRYGTRRIMDLPETGEVLTPCGWKPYRNPRITRAAAPLVEVTFADGFTARCTPDHMFWTDSGWKSASDLRKGSLIRSSLTRSRSISMAASTACGRAARIGRAVASSFIATSGRMLSALYPMVATSPTGTGTVPTIGCPTWSVSRPTSILPKLSSSVETPRMGSISPPKLGAGLLSGMRRKPVGFGTSDTLNAQRAGPSGSALASLVFVVARNLWHSFVRTAINRNIVPKTARWLTIADVRPLSERADVWCLTVPDGNCFSLGNGAIVHNCDAFRYLCLGLKRPETRPDTPVNARRGAMRDVGRVQRLGWVR